MCAKVYINKVAIDYLQKTGLGPRFQPGTVDPPPAEELSAVDSCWRQEHDFFLRGTPTSEGLSIPIHVHLGSTELLKTNKRTSTEQGMLGGHCSRGRCN